MDNGSVTGRVYVGDLSYELQHAYAYAPPGGDELWVYLTDTSLTEDQVADRFGVHEAARAGQVHGVKLTLDPADSDPKSLSAVLLMPPEGEDASLTSISSSGSESSFEQLSLPPAPIAGRVRFEQKAIFESLPYGFDVEFQFAGSPSASTGTGTATPVTLTGVDAQTSPQAEAFLAGEAAVLSGDLTEAARYMAPDRIAPIRQFKEQVSPEEFEAMLDQQRQGAPGIDERRQQITEVVVEGDEAALSTSTGESAQLRKTEGRWIAR